LLPIRGSAALQLGHYRRLPKPIHGKVDWLA
jgi:hypothetical protein